MNKEFAGDHPIWQFWHWGKKPQQIDEPILSPTQIFDRLTISERGFVIGGLKSRFAQDGKTITDEYAQQFLTEHPGALCNALMKPSYPNKAMQKRLSNFNKALISWEDSVAAARTKGS